MNWKQVFTKICKKRTEGCRIAMIVRSEPSHLPSIHEIEEVLKRADSSCVQFSGYYIINLSQQTSIVRVFFATMKAIKEYNSPIYNVFFA